MVRIRMKRMGRKNRPFYRLVAVDARGSRDGRVIEYLGHYDPMVPDTDARAILNGERVDYWLKVGAQPSDKVAVLIKKYGANGSHLDKQKAALERMKGPRNFVPVAPVSKVRKKGERAEEPAPVEAESSGEEAVEAAAQEG